MEPRHCIADQLLAKVDVIGAMHERGQLCLDPQPEFALLRESLGVSRVNNIFRVHGHTILNEEAAAKTLLGFTEDSAQQATLSAGQSGIGCKRLVDVLRPVSALWSPGCVYAACAGSVLAPHQTLSPTCRRDRTSGCPSSKRTTRTATSSPTVCLTEPDRDA